MRKKSFILFFSLLFISLSVVAQNKNWVGAEIGPIFLLFQESQEGTGIKTPAIPVGMLGINLRHQVNERLLIEGGLYKSNYLHGYGFTVFEYKGTLAGSIETLQIPIRLKYRKKLFESKVSILTHIGLNYLYDRSGLISGTYSESHREIPGNITVKSSHNFTINSQHSFLLSEFGLGVDFRILNYALFSINGNYQIGFQKIIRIYVDYSINGGAQQSGEVFFRGNNYQILLGLKIPIDKLVLYVVKFGVKT